MCHKLEIVSWDLFLIVEHCNNTIKHKNQIETPAPHDYKGAAILDYRVHSTNSSPIENSVKSTKFGAS